MSRINHVYTVNSTPLPCLSQDNWIGYRKELLVIQYPLGVSRRRLARVVMGLAVARLGAPALVSLITVILGVRCMLIYTLDLESERFI